MHINWKSNFKQVGLALLVATVVSLLYLKDAFQQLEWFGFDQRMIFANAQKSLNPQIAIILIDDASLKALDPIVGRFPWPRSVYADVLDFLALGHPKAVVFDILFTERQEKSHKIFLEESSDQALIKATGRYNFVYHAAHFGKKNNDENEIGLTGVETLPDDFVNRFGISTTSTFNLPANQAFAVPLNGLYQASMGIGAVNIEADRDGTYRRAPLLHSYANKFYPALGITPLFEKTNKFTVNGKTNLHFSTQTIPIQEDGKMLLNGYGKYNAYSLSGILAAIQQINNGDVENLIVSPQEFRDKYIFIGVAATGLEDVKVTPLSSKTPGVMLHATVLSNVLDKSYLAPVSPLFTIALTFILAMIINFVIFKFRRVTVNLVFPSAIALVFSSVAFWSFKYNLVLDLAPPLIAIILTWLAAVTYQSFMEGKDKRKVRRMLAQYVAPAILAEVVDKYEHHIKAEIGTTENVTTMFSDVRSFTNISEKLKPEQVVELLNCHFSEMVDVIFKYEGTLDKFIGDALMAFWGAPVHTPDHAVKAVNAAFEMINRLSSVNVELSKKNLPAIKIGIGLNTGNVILGNIGSEKKLDYTIIGDNVNLASRMEGLTGKYGCEILVSENTYESIREIIPCAIIDLVRVKGKETPIGIYMPLVSNNSAFAEIDSAKTLAHEMTLAFNLYLKRNWKQAIIAFEKIPLTQVRERMSERCRLYNKCEPPPEWDGVQILTSK